MQEIQKKASDFSNGDTSRERPKGSATHGFLDYQTPQSYKVNTIYSAIQGEGGLTGVPMVVLRLQGCNLACPFCDTKETWDIRAGMLMNTIGIVKAVKGQNRSGNISWVMLTGGEPTLQNLSELLVSLDNEGYSICLETSGTATHLRQLQDFAYIVLSPKQHHDACDSNYQNADEIKFVVTDKASLDWFIARIENLFYEDGKMQSPWDKTIDIYLQPVSLDEEMTTLCYNTCLEKGWNFSPQVHKLLGLP